MLILSCSLKLSNITGLTFSFFNESGYLYKSFAVVLKKMFLALKLSVSSYLDLR